ncbi:hypothetical protein M378DRAFT_632769 [Amanita muscaria Koide BX008]|uniref:Uncharacterized protein n=1 Tax=Amanita muscaria (strain Koide BX008) TaxID=946122 RepID=A0A0C2SM35_AMAMK|nr:hypothetical protein M378DRAFT_632769 [Amanita muscaria Koide BX008]
MGIVPHLRHCCIDRSITKFTDELQRKFGERIHAWTSSFSPSIVVILDSYCIVL